MTDSLQGDDREQDVSGEGRAAIASTAIASAYKVLGELTDSTGAGVLGQNNASNGTPIGVEGSVPNADGGYGLYTVDDAGIEGVLDTSETDFVVEAGTTTTNDARNVVLGHAFNDVLDGAVGGTVSGGGFDDGSIARRNTVADNYATVGGGRENQAGDGDGDPTTAEFATVGGGQLNTASGDSSTVGGGDNNTASVDHATVAGGEDNVASGNGSAVGGGESNTATDTNTTVAGGQNNEASGFYATVAGGEGNRAGALHSTVGGGDGNVADNKLGTTVAGGVDNQAINRWSTVGGGQHNVADADNATVSGGDNNVADTINATVGGGSSNQATGGQSTVAGGSNNHASGVSASVGGGYDNVASDRMATVPGGRENEASGEFSFATGRRASALHDGSVVFGDSTATTISSNFADVALFQQRVDIGDGGNSGVRLMVEGDSAVDSHLLRVRDTGTTKFAVHDNGGTSVGTLNTPPADGLRIGGETQVDELGAGIYLGYDQKIQDETSTLVDFNVLKFETAGSFFGGKYTADRDGRFLVMADLCWEGYDPGWGTGEWYSVMLYKNGTRILRNTYTMTGNGHQSMRIHRTVPLSPNDDLWVEVNQESGGERQLIGNSDHNSFEVIHLG